MVLTTEKSCMFWRCSFSISCVLINCLKGKSPCLDSDIIKIRYFMSLTKKGQVTNPEECQRYPVGNYCTLFTPYGNSIKLGHLHFLIYHHVLISSRFFVIFLLTFYFSCFRMLGKAVLRTSARQLGLQQSKRVRMSLFPEIDFERIFLLFKIENYNFLMNFGKLLSNRFQKSYNHQYVKVDRF